MKHIHCISMDDCEQVLLESAVIQPFFRRCTR